MTLLGHFALWAAFLIGLWGAVIAFAGRWRDRPEQALTVVRSVYAVANRSAASLPWTSARLVAQCATSSHAGPREVSTQSTTPEMRSSFDKVCILLTNNTILR